jgi:hypothetical protein
MKQHEAVIEVMKANGGFATFSHLYAEVLKVPSVKWGTKTPFASIRRIVQDERFFFKIRPGLWALKDYKDKLPFAEAISPKASEQQQAEFNHTYFQGLLVEIGNFKKFDTFVPNQDKNRQFLNKPLAELVTLQEYYQFTYDNIIKQARTVDVTWFNERRLPNTFIEVEHSTDIHRSLLKFVELQDFYTAFVIVAPEARKVEFASKLALSAFQPIQTRVKFWNYENVSKLHTNLSELAVIEQIF